MYINRQDTGTKISIDYINIRVTLMVKKEKAGLYLAPPTCQLTKVMSHIIMLSSIALIPSHHAFNWSTDR